MNKKLVIAMLLPGLGACAGHAVKNGYGTRKIASAPQPKISADVVKKLIATHNKTQASFAAESQDALSDDPAKQTVPAGVHQLRVFVSDGGGNPIVGVNVQVTDAQEHVQNQNVNKNGNAVFKLTPGTFSVHASGTTLVAALDKSVTLNGAGAHSLLTLQGDEKGNGDPEPKDGVISIGSSVVKTQSVDISTLPSYQKPFSSGQWTNLGEMCKWQRMPWDNNNSKKLSFGDSIYSPWYVSELSVGCNVYKGALVPKAKVTTDFINGQHSYLTTNGSTTPDDAYKIDPSLETDTPGKHDKSSVYSFNVVEGASQSVVLKEPTSNFYFSADSAGFSADSASINAFSEDLVGRAMIGGQEYSFVNYQIKEYWVIATLNDGTSGNPVKDGTAIVQQLRFLVSGKTGYPIVAKDQFFSTVDPDTFEVAVRATGIAQQDPTLAQNPVTAYTTAYAKAEGAQAGPEDGLMSWNYFREGTQSAAMLKNLVDSDAVQELDFSPLNPGAQWFSQMGLSLSYTQSPTNNVYSWKNAQDMTHGTTFTVRTYAPKWGSGQHTDASGFGTITPHFLGALQELTKFGPSLGAVQISDADVQSLIQEARKNIAQTPQQ